MNRAEAIELLNEIIASCPALALGGFYTRDIRSSLDCNVELRLFASLDRDSRKIINSILTKYGLKMIEEVRLLIIY